ncbi:EAL domain-containing protein [Phenylobacterium sp. J426]|uniref:EAL domain-containing protein n=1 Tax=Phenylobacterium sp. J426 TaxID=2898439 RepID=UPI002151AB59|nr:EAL domain-containing protein [Phenylobacterium sp. J426]MCR5876563.1 EAL domain-containing protein [Phenylobacterium sp. J426]
MEAGQQGEVDWRVRLSERAALATRAAAIGIWEWNLRGSNHIWDDQMRALYGFTADQRIDLPSILRSIDDRDRQRVTAELEAASRGAPLDTEFRVRTPEGATRWLRTMGELAQDGGVDGQRMIGATWDVTAGQVMADALHQEKEQLHVTLASIGDAVVVTDVLGRVRFINAAAETLLALDARAAVGRPLDSVMDLRSIVDGSSLDNLALTSIRQAATRLERLAWLTTSIGATYEIQATVSSIRTRHGDIIGAVLVVQDITEARRLERQLRHAATHDPLTGLANRALLQEALGEAVEAAVPGGPPHVLCYLDVDQFKLINDTAGHEAGDHYLRQVSGLIKTLLQPNDLLARIGGDEFALILRGRDAKDSIATAESIIQTATNFRFVWKDRVFRTGLSVGMCQIDGAFSPGEVLSHADMACYEAKLAGRGRVAMFEPGDKGMAERRREMAVVAGMRDVLSENRLILFAQPIVAANDGDEERRYELLVRMIDTSGDLVAPGAFIPAAEKFDLMAEIDRWVLEEAIGRLGPKIARLKSLRISINLSANSLNNPGTLVQLIELLDRSPIHTSSLTFEITETAALNNIATAGGVMERLRALGCSIALDDFGSGLSSFAYLKHFAVDSVKIDGSFIRNIARDETDRAIVESMNALAHRLGASTVAEFVEDEATMEVVRSIGVDFLQGYAFGRPAPFEKILEDLAAELASG